MSGRPNKVETAVLDYLQSKNPPVLDLKLDARPLTEWARTTGVEAFSLRGAVDRLKEKGYLHLLQSGRYLIREEPAPTPRLWSLDPVADAVLRQLEIDYYISWHAALWHYNLIDQQSRTVAVAVQRRKRDVVIGASRVRFIHVGGNDGKRFFGGRLLDEFEWPVKMATMSRALIDAFDRPDLVGPPAVVVEALRRAWQSEGFDPTELVADARRFERVTLNRRLGFFMDLLEVPGSEALLPYTGRSPVEPLFRGYEPRQKLDVDRKWRVFRDPGIIGTVLELK
jgi:predicted transcriptional regulator of viral defense system